MNRLQVAPPVALTLLALLALLAGCGDAPPADSFPQAAADGWVGSFNGGDVAGLTLMYAADAAILPPDEPVHAGPEEIQRFWEGYGPGQVRIELGDVESRRIGEFWFREGAYKAEFPDEGEPRVGKFIELWKQENGNWLMYRQMWNRNAPIGTPAPTEEAPPADEPA